MSDVLQQFLDRLPSFFDKSENSNIHKLFQIIANQTEQHQTLLETIRRYQDLDQATGKTLDLHGKDVGLERGSYDDETYRKMIKIQIIVNLSEGDIEAINTILRAYMGDDFLFIEESWRGVLEKSAAMEVNIADTTPGFPHELLKRIKPAGVGYYVLANQLAEQMRVDGRSYTFPVQYRVTNQFRTAPMHGAKAEINIKTGEGAYPFVVNYPVCGQFSAGGE